MTISAASEAWGVDRSTIKRWIAKGRIEASKDNAGIWRIAPGQQPPPSLELHHGRAKAAPSSPQGRALRPPQEAAPEATQVQAKLAELTDALAETKIALALAEREVELLRERLAHSQVEQDRLHELLRETLTRPSLLERLLRAIRGAAKGSTAEGG